jgi:hypothetical protein
MSDWKQKLKNSIVPSLISGAIGTGVYYFIFGSATQSITVPFGPIQLSSMYAVGGGIAVGTLVGEVATEFVLPKIQGSGYSSYEEMAVPPVLSGLGSWLTMKMLITKDAQFMTPFLLGAASSSLGKTVYGVVQVEKMLF